MELIWGSEGQSQGHSGKNLLKQHFHVRGLQYSMPYTELEL